ncbi:MAG TPA: glutamyl-tRNA reductase [Nitrososphaeraceae archaeon]
MSTASISKHLQVLNVRITFRNAPVHLLEKFALKNQKAACKLFKQQAALDECVILQTCNRVEVFGAGGTINEQNLLKTWASEVGMSSEELVKVAEVSTGKEVVSHLLRLAAGLDSLVVGEDQILGQMKRAFEFSRVNHYVGPDLSMVFDKAFKVGSRVRSSTGVNKGSVSIGSMAVNLAEENLDTLHDKSILLIGSGEGASLVAKALRQRSIKFQVTSRTFDRAKSFAVTVAGNPVTFDKALESLCEVDLIFVSTTAPYFLITNDRIQSAMRDREKGMMICDLSNPRTVEESVAGIRKVKLVNLDQISEIVEKNIRFRKKEIMSAERIIDSEMKSVDILLKRKKVEPLVVSIFKSVDTIRKRELFKTLSILGNDINPMERRVIEQLSHSLVEGILAAPMNNLRREIDTDGKDQEELVRLLAKLFKYEQN